MIQTYLLAVGELRCQMERMAYIKENHDGGSGVSLGDNLCAAALTGWDKLAGWQQEKISRCAAPGTRALCMGGQLLLQYGAYEWSACNSRLQSESWEKKNVPGDKDVKGVIPFGVSNLGAVTTENMIFWRIIDFSQLPESIPAPQSLEAAYEPRGKPYILHVPWHYNLSHSGDYVALAISDVPVGIDIQQMRPYRDSLVKRFFSVEEAAAYENIPSQNIRRRECFFYTLWCRKEAYGKLLGTGLTEDVLKRNMIEDAKVHLYEYGEIPGYCICVCGKEG